MKKMGKLLFYTITGCLLAAGVNDACAQFSLSKLAKERSDDNVPKKPTSITADSMDIDFKSNIAVFTGHVVVDDPSMTINCHKMEIFLDNKAKTDDSKESEEKSDNKAGNMGFGGGKELKKIICSGDVVIVRKLYNKEDIAAGEQKATAGRAVYDVKADMIVLTLDNPTIQRGTGDKLSGPKITLWLNSERLKVEGDETTGNQRATIKIDNFKNVNK